MVPLNTRYTAAEAGDILARVEAPVLFGMGEFLGNDRVADLDRAALPALRHIVRIPIDAADGTWDEFIAGGTDLDAVAARAAAVTPDDVSDILFTSGTTGRSKGVLCAHRQSLSASASWAANGKITADDRYLCINPFFHNFGYKAGILACLQTGATLIPTSPSTRCARCGRSSNTASPYCPVRQRFTRPCSIIRLVAITT